MRDDLIGPDRGNTMSIPIFKTEKKARRASEPVLDLLYVKCC